MVVDAEEYGASDSKPTRTIWLRAQEHRVSEPLLVQAIETNIAMETQQTTKRQRGRRRPLVSPQASLLLQTRRRNKPLVHVAAGHVTLKNLRLGHYCGGFNLWCGNSCVQVQPITPPETVAPLLPTANIESCEIVSHSGRGVVVNDGGNVTVSHSYIHDCAATGIYVGSHSCTLTLSHSDLISNGNGNRLAASVRATGVSRGHSGFYLENGNATLREVNISNNSSCGISVSSSESKLTLDHSDVVANGHSNQMEVTLGSQRLGAHNTVARTGLVKVRSKLALHKCFGGSGSDTATCRSRSSSSSSSARSQQNLPANRTRTDSDSSMEPLAATEEQNDGEDDLEHLQDSYVVAEENVRFGELIEI